MELEQFRQELRGEFDLIHRRINESNANLGSKIDSAANTLGDVKIDVAVLKESAHKPDSCTGLTRHEKDHEKGASMLSKILTALGIVGIVAGAATVILKAII